MDFNERCKGKAAQKDARVCSHALARGHAELGADTSKVRASCDSISMFFSSKFPTAVPSGPASNSSTIQVPTGLSGH